MSEEPPAGGEQPPADDEERGHAEEDTSSSPKPNTWAGRARAESDDGAPGQPDEEGDDAGPPQASEGKDTDASPGELSLTEDFARVEREMAAELDEIDTDERAQAARIDHEVAGDPEDETPGAAEPEAGDGEQAPLDPADPDPADEQPEPPDELSFEPPAAEPTVEAETLSLADEEAAREAALAGLRARTTQHSTAGAPLARQAATAPTSPPAVAAAAASGASDGPGEAPKLTAWWRFVAAASVIVMSMAAATAVYFLLFLTDVAEGIGHNGQLASLRDQLQEVNGGPQTIMFLGSDSRAKDPQNIKKGEDPGRSDTTLLARVDPDANTINLLSLPRDLKVNIPGTGVDKLNAAYTYGGPRLTLRTVRNLLGIDVNHVVNIDFDGFYDAVNAIDCVYVDVDRHYLHSNEGLAPSEYYAEIDVPAGYQRLCGFQALNYVRYRHDDNDLVRGARQQDFVRELRQRIPPEKFLDEDLRNIFIKYTTSDISTPTALLEVLKTLFDARGASVRQIPFEGDIGDATSTYVTASDKQIKDLRNQFLAAAPPPPPPPGPSGKRDKAKKDKKKRKPAPPVAVVDVAANTQAKAQEFAAKKATDFPVLYPTKAIPSATLSDDSRAFPILGPEEKNIYRGFKYVFAFSAGGFEAYYGFSGTDWKDAPILDDPSETRQIGDTDYELFYDGGKLRLVGWKTSKGAYWVNNSLTKLLTEPQMLAIAESARALGK